MNSIPDILLQFYFWYLFLIVCKSQGNLLPTLATILFGVDLGTADNSCDGFLLSLTDHEAPSKISAFNQKSCYWSWGPRSYFLAASRSRRDSGSAPFEFVRYPFGLVRFVWVYFSKCGQYHFDDQMKRFGSNHYEIAPAFGSAFLWSGLHSFADEFEYWYHITLIQVVQLLPISDWIKPTSQFFFRMWCYLSATSRL